MPVVAVVALVAVLAAQAAFWALLYTQVFLGALVANTVFWCVAFPGWAWAGRRWWRTSPAPDTTLALMLVAVTAAAFRFAQGGGERDAANAWGWVGFYGVPVALIASLFATLRVRAVRRATDITGAVAADAPLGPKPVTVAIISAVVIALALVVFALLIAVSIGGPHSAVSASSIGSRLCAISKKSS